MSDDILLPLRPHHGMCLSFFKGEGYSIEFTENMWNIRKALMPGALVSSGGARRIRLVLQSDAVCAACPHKRGAMCDHEERVRQIDAGVLKACGLLEGTVMDFEDLAGLIETRILTPGLRSGICDGCQWGHICGAPFGSAF